MARNSAVGCSPAVLLASGDHAGQQAVSLMLAALGAAVSAARSGIEAAHHANSHQYAVIFLDSGSPDLELMQTTRAIRDDENVRRQVPATIIALLDEPAMQHHDEYLLGGVTDCLRKPVTFAMLRRTIDMALRSHTETAAVPLDDGALAQLRQLEGRSAGLVQRVVTAYLTRSEELLAGLRRGLLQADAQQIFAAAHALKSSSMDVGAMRLAEIARRLEADARGGDIRDAESLIARIEAEHPRVCSALEDYLPRRTA